MCMVSKVGLNAYILKDWQSFLGTMCDRQLNWDVYRQIKKKSGV